VHQFAIASLGCLQAWCRLLLDNRPLPARRKWHGVLGLVNYWAWLTFFFCDLLHSTQRRKMDNATMPNFRESLSDLGSAPSFHEWSGGFTETSYPFPFAREYWVQGCATSAARGAYQTTSEDGKGRRRRAEMRTPSRRGQGHLRFACPKRCSHASQPWRKPSRESTRHPVTRNIIEHFTETLAKSGSLRKSKLVIGGLMTGTSVKEIVSASDTT